MQIVIDINEEVYNKLLEEQRFPSGFNLAYPIIHGTPLPKGHGRLIDAEKTLEIAWQDFYKHEKEWEEKDENYLPLHRFYDQNGFECCQRTIVNAPTIIEADKENKTC